MDILNPRVEQLVTIPSPSVRSPEKTIGNWTGMRGARRVIIGTSLLKREMSYPTVYEIMYDTAQGLPKGIRPGEPNLSIFGPGERATFGWVTQACLSFKDAIRR